MNNFLYYLLDQANSNHIQIALAILRIGIGFLTIGHGLPKITGGLKIWEKLGAFMHPLGIYFWPVFWGFMGASIEFFGGIALVLGLGTRIASLFNILMMIVATVWHISRGDSFSQISFPVSLIFVFLALFIIGGDRYSLDYYITQRLINL